MDKEQLKKLAQNEDFIPGIYNYCDRWCERCAFTSCCMNYAIDEDACPDPETQDITNKAFWDKLKEVFQLTIEMLEEIAEEKGIDLNSIDIETTKEEQKRKREAAENQECALAAKVYAEMVDDWFDSAKDLFKEKEDELKMKLELDLPNANPVEEASTLKDFLEIIRWYQHQIYVKLMRALIGKQNEEIEELKDFPKDYDGSAKVALIAIDRSISAWGGMRGHFPEREDEILDLLIHLDRLRRKIELEFPNARQFVRPGFDTIDGQN